MNADPALLAMAGAATASVGAAAMFVIRITLLVGGYIQRAKDEREHVAQIPRLVLAVDALREKLEETVDKVERVERYKSGERRDSREELT